MKFHLFFILAAVAVIADSNFISTEHKVPYETTVIQSQLQNLIKIWELTKQGIDKYILNLSSYSDSNNNLPNFYFKTFFEVSGSSDQLNFNIYKQIKNNHSEDTAKEPRSFGKCSSPFVRIDKKCFYISQKSANWFEATNFCTQFESNLLSFDEPDLIKEKLLSEYIDRTADLKEYFYWTSGTDQAKTGQWRWQNTGNSVNDGVNHWCFPEKGAKAPQFHCLVYNYQYNHCWSNLNCSSNFHDKWGIRYICERDLF